MHISVDERCAFGALNVILYCRRFQETVRFYAEVLSLPQRHAVEWFVEFEVAPGAFISVADQRRASVKSAGGAGLTLTLKVDDAAALRERLRQHGLDPPAVEARPWGAAGFFIHDPEGTRIEIWSTESPAAP